MAYGGDSGSRKKPVHVTSLKRKSSDHPVSASQPSITNPILRRKSSGRTDCSSSNLGVSSKSSVLKRNSRGKGDDSSAVPRVASMFRRSPSSNETMTSKILPSDFSERQHSVGNSMPSAVYRSHLVPTTKKSSQTSMVEDEEDALGQADLAFKTSFPDIFKPRVTPRDVKSPSPRQGIEEPPTFVPSELHSVVSIETNEATSTVDSPVDDLHPFPPPSPQQSPPRSPTMLRKLAEKAEDLTDENLADPPSLSPVASKVNLVHLTTSFF